MAAASRTRSPAQDQVETIYLQGQALAEKRDFGGAAECYARLLGLVPESQDTRELREAFMLNALDAYLKAHVGQAGSKDVVHLEKARDLLDVYYADFAAAHGDRVGVIQPVIELAEELERELKRVEVKPPPPPPPPLPPGGAAPQQSQRNRRGLLIGGAAMSALSVGALAMIPIGLVRGRKANGALQDAHDRLDSASVLGQAREDAEEDRQRAYFVGRQANAVLISGAVLAPAFLGGAATLFYFGLRKNKSTSGHRAKLGALRPWMSRRDAGLVFSGRF